MDIEWLCVRLFYDILVGGWELVYFDDWKIICSVVDGGDDIVKWFGVGKWYRGYVVIMFD